MGAALWSWFLVGSEGTVRHQQQQQHHQQQQQAQQLQAAGPAAAITLCFYQNPEGTSSPGTAFFGGCSVLQGHGVLLPGAAAAATAAVVAVAAAAVSLGAAVAVR